MSRAETVIVVLSGIPASGKSRFAAQICQKWRKKFSVIHLCYDDLIPLEEQKKLSQDEDRENSKRWKELRNSILTGIENRLIGTDCESEFSEKISKLFEVKKEEKSLPKVILVDDNNYLSSMRYSWFQLARKLNIGFCQLFFQTDLDIALSRNQSRDETSRIPDTVIERMFGKIEIPKPMINSWEAFSFTIDNSEDSKDDSQTIDFCENIVNLALSNPVLNEDEEKARKAAEKDKSRAACTASIVHRSDQILRKIVGTELKSSRENGESKTEIQDKSKKLNSVKAEILEDLKTGFTKIPTEIVKKFGDGKNEEINRNLEICIKELFELKVKTSE